MKKIIVAGGSRGIGAATVRKFAYLGYDVTFYYKSREEEAQLLSRETGALARKVDITDPEAVKIALCEETSAPDVLVCCAGIAFIGQICDTDDEKWHHIIDTNLSGAFYLCREASRLMVSKHSGRIITVGSVWGRCGASCEVAYSASKAGIRGLTKALAKELAPSGITVNCVEPGVIDTEMNALLGDETKRELCEEIPASRIGSADEVAEVIGFLASDGASYVTGQCIGVDGGFCL